MKKPEKIPLLVSNAILITLVLLSMANTAKADIEDWVWLQPLTYKGYDSLYYEYRIVAYLNGTTASIKIPVYNIQYAYVNITAVSIVFSWGTNITDDYIANPVKINYHETYFFDVTFMADTSQFPSEIAHTYTLYAKYIDSHGRSDEWSRSWSSLYPAYKFVVFSQDQNDVMDIYEEYSAYRDNYPPNSFITTEGRLLATQATAAASEGASTFRRGEFTEAKAHYQTAVDLYNQAFAAEESQGVAMENANLDALTKGANATVKEAEAAVFQAQASMNQAYGYLLFGAGIVLIGVGAITYGVRKPKTIQT